MNERCTYGIALRASERLEKLTKWNSGNWLCAPQFHSITSYATLSITYISVGVWAYLSITINLVDTPRG